MLEEFCRKPRGFVLVTGPTGSGKSTTLASMIDLINDEREEHILTIEDPIEFLHRHKKCIVNQREIGADAVDFAVALKSALREDPDVILVGEMRDLETISTALTAAETGHLVFATLHTQSTAQTVDRIIDVFPPHQQQQVRMQLSVALQGIVTQQLLPTADGSGRGRRVRGADPDARDAQPDPRGQDAPDLLGHPDPARSACRPWTAHLAQLVRDGEDHPALAEQRSSVPEESSACSPAAARARRRRRPAGRTVGRRSTRWSMGAFAFRAVDVAGVPAAVRWRPPPRAQVAEQLRQRGLIVLDVSEQHEAFKLEASSSASSVNCATSRYSPGSTRR